ncbi:MAG: Hpt domain-containing protein [Bacillota bacterium]|nr:hypothetical protein [Bacillota bacterium]HWR55253.1 Hpt domain-containing protein [Negativicutes bacterium]
MYDLKRAAAELCLEPADLQEIYEDFFFEAGGLLAAGKTQLAKGDFENLRRTLHALKGMAVNLRMERLGLLARQAGEALRQDHTLLEGLLGEIPREIDKLRAQINNFYSG